MQLRIRNLYGTWFLKNEVKMDNIIIYDTSNFVDFPIGGQLTSIRNFLMYLTEIEEDVIGKVILVGITNEEGCVGKLSNVNINEVKIDFIPVVYRNKNLKDVQNSLRLEFVKGLFRYKHLIPCTKNSLHYIHTPEAFIQIKFCHPFSKIATFSHGSFYNMPQGFRFFQNNKIVEMFFNLFLKCLIKKSDIIFCLDDDSVNQYKKHNHNVHKVDNSIILPQEKIKKVLHYPVELLFVGRLSKVKQIDEIIYAIDGEKNMSLTIVGDGEEYDYLSGIVKGSNIHFVGAANQEQVREYMQKSDILILNSVLEGKPMTIMEAESYGLPIITTNVGGIGELVKFNENAIETDGKSNSIQKAIFDISKQYDYYSKKSLEISKKFDYRKVNQFILIKLKKQFE